MVIFYKGGHINLLILPKLLLVTKSSVCSLAQISGQYVVEQPEMETVIPAVTISLLVSYCSQEEYTARELYL